MTAPLGTRSVQDVVVYVQRQFGDESGVQVTAEDIIRWINQGSMELVSKNPIIQSVASLTYSARDYGYRVPGDIIQVQAVVWSADPEYPASSGGIGGVGSLPVAIFPGASLKPVDMSEGLKQRGLLGASGEPSCFYMWNNVIYLVPQPADHTTAITLFYNSAPTPVSTLGDLLGIPDRYYDKLLMFVMSKAYELDQDWSAHDTQRSQFESELKELNFADLNTQGSYPTIRSADDSYDRYW